MRTNPKISALSRALLVLSAIMLTVSIFVPIWRIDLDAPQYPEGLRLLIHADKLGGNVDIINGLNHYIGMKTLHTEDFIEFTVLPYLIGFFALFSLVAALVGRKKVLYVLFAAFVLFGVVAMVDFWRWEYDYGHNLDPNAAIIVPGMAYQPPLIGFKQLLNFGAYSVPSTGGWLFVASGVLMLVGVLYETKALKRKHKTHKAAAAGLVLAAGLFSCTPEGPQEIRLNSDQCEFCKMTIADARFAAELITKKGRVYKFDDIACMQNYSRQNEKTEGARNYVCDYLQPGSLIEIEKAAFIRGDNVNSPMGGNVAAFRSADSALGHAHQLAGTLFSWQDLSNGTN